MPNRDEQKLPKDTPVWFRKWHSGSFWHFRYGVEQKLCSHDKLLWVIIAAIIAAALANRFL